MTLRAEAEAAVGRKPMRSQATTCTVVLLLGRLPDDERTELEAIIADPDEPAAYWARFLWTNRPDKVRGLSNSASSLGAVLQRHRRGDCKCH